MTKYNTISYLLARKARNLTDGMLARTGRLPDYADYDAAFCEVLRNVERAEGLDIIGYSPKTGEATIREYVTAKAPYGAKDNETTVATDVPLSVPQADGDGNETEFWRDQHAF